MQHMMYNAWDYQAYESHSPLSRSNLVCIKDLCRFLWTMRLVGTAEMSKFSKDREASTLRLVPLSVIMYTHILKYWQ